MKVISQIFLFTIIILLSFTPSVYGQSSEWKLKTKKNNITIYIRDVKDSKLKELKMITIVKSNLASIVKILDEVENYPDWMYGCSAGKKVKSNEVDVKYFITTMKFPSPFSDRSVVTKSTTHQDEKTKVVTMKSVAVDDPGFQNKKLVMMKDMTSTWILTPLTSGEVQIDSYLFCDPGGNIPSWLVNSLIDKGPYNSLVNLRNRLTSPKYQNIKLPHIQEK